MSYEKYTTEAMVLTQVPRGEHDKVYALYTRDFGLVYARASAVRAEKSKMRYALQSHAHARVSLVRGSRGWRAAGASCHGAGLGRKVARLRPRGCVKG
jgi:recombinational DNA repair protein (RecF pathway)